MSQPTPPKPADAGHAQGTGSCAPSDAVAAADLEQIAADLQGLQTQIQAMQRDLASLRRQIARAPRTQAVAWVMALAATGLAWWLQGSAWLRYGVLPVTLGLGLLFTLCAPMLERWMQGRIAQLQRFADHATAQLASARQAQTPSA